MIDSTLDQSPSLELKLADLLDELSAVQDELLRMLALKRDKIADRDLPGVAALQPHGEQLCDRLQACQQRRSELLAEASDQGQKTTTLGELVETLPGDHSDDLTRKVKSISSRTRLLQHQSLANWVLAQRSILHLSQLLEIIATGGQLQPTYGGDHNTHSGGALVDREA